MNKLRLYNKEIQVVGKETGAERASCHGERMSSFALSCREMSSIRALAVEKYGYEV